jgi:hypothetical protein
MRRRRILGLLAAAPAVVRSAAAQTDDWPKVVDAAKKEGKLLIYTASTGSPFHKKVIQAFEAKYEHQGRPARGAGQRRCASGCGSSSRPAASSATFTTTARPRPG